jgi:hypothetical protein
MRRFLPLLSLLLAAAACSGSKVTAPSDSNWFGVPGLTTRGPGVLTVSPIDTAQLVRVDPLGQMSPPGHTLPSDHEYWFFVNPLGNPLTADCSKRPIRAAGAGTVSFMLETEPGNWKVIFAMTQTFGYYYDHIVPAAGIVVGATVSAGQQVGTTTGGCPSFDVGVIDFDVTLPGLITPERYGAQTLHAGRPIGYFTEPLRSALLARSSRTAGDAYREGRIDYGIRGKLVGDWFATTLPRTTDSTGPAGWTQSLCFAYDNVDPSKIRISVGGGALPMGLWNVGGGAADPANVGVSSGKVVYQLIPYGGASQPGYLAVQLIAEDRIRVQVFPNSTDPNPAFTSAAVEYVR